MEPIRRYIWMIDLLSRERLTREEISTRWERSSLNEMHEPISRRTFIRDRQNIEEKFDIEIQYDPTHHTYTLMDTEPIRSDKLLQYLLEQNRILDLASLSKQMREKIMLESPCSGSEHLATILEAIATGVTLRFKYISYYEPNREKNYELIPSFVRLFAHRWYLIGEFVDHSQHRVLALERMNDIHLSEQKTKPSAKVDPETFYRECYGIIHDDSKPQKIRIKVFGPQVNYIRSVPLHDSQIEEEQGEDYAIFSIFVRPSYDLIQQLLWNREQIEVISPEVFRNQIIDILRQMMGRYSI